MVFARQFPLGARWLSPVGFCSAVPTRRQVVFAKQFPPLGFPLTGIAHAISAQRFPPGNFCQAVSVRRQVVFASRFLLGGPH